MQAPAPKKQKIDDTLQARSKHYRSLVIEQLRLKLQKAKSEAADQTEATERAQEVLEAKNKSKAELTSQLELQEAQESQLKDRIATLQGKLAKYQESQRELTQKNSETKGLLSNLNKSLSRAEKHLVKTQTKLKEKTKVVKQLEDELRELRSVPSLLHVIVPKDQAGRLELFKSLNVLPASSSSSPSSLPELPANLTVNCAICCENAAPGYTCSVADCIPKVPACVDCLRQRIGLWAREGPLHLFNKSQGLLACVSCATPCSPNDRAILQAYEPPAEANCLTLRALALAYTERREALLREEQGRAPALAAKILDRANTFRCPCAIEGTVCGASYVNNYLHKTGEVVNGEDRYVSDTNCLVIKCEVCTGQFCALCGYAPTDIERQEYKELHRGQDIYPDIHHEHFYRERCRMSSFRRSEDGEGRVYLVTDEDRELFAAHCRARAYLIAAQELRDVQNELRQQVAKELVALDTTFVDFTPLEPNWICPARTCIKEGNNQGHSNPAVRALCTICGHPAPCVFF